MMSEWSANGTTAANVRKALLSVWYSSASSASALPYGLFKFTGAGAILIAYYYYPSLGWVQVESVN